MKITDLRIWQLEGVMDYPHPFWEDRLRMPLDIFSKYRNVGPELLAKHPAHLEDDKYKVVCQFLEIETDEGVTGMSGPMFYYSTASYILNSIKPHLIGEDPLRTEYLWDIMYRSNLNARAGEFTAAISMVDIALWDLKGKYLGQPVCSLLGGPVQEKIQCYASALCCSIEPDKVAARVKEYIKNGYVGIKIFTRDGPSDGLAGMSRIVELIERVRSETGPDFKIMIDAWCSWDVPYTIKMSELLADFDVEWFEEPCLPSLRPSHARLRERCPVKIAGGEHDFMRWEAKQLMEIGAFDIYQFDVVWAGGISEMMKMTSLCTVYDYPLIPHGVSMQATAAVAFAHNCATVPLLEYLFVEQERFQFFFKETVKPIDGYIHAPTSPGLGMTIDESKVDSRTEIKL